MIAGRYTHFSLLSQDSIRRRRQSLIFIIRNHMQCEVVRHRLKFCSDVPLLNDTRIVTQGFAELVLERDSEENYASATSVSSSASGDNQSDYPGGGATEHGKSAATTAFTMPEILEALRRVCLSRTAVPVLCGASLRGIGVEPLLDSVSTFLPSPLDRPRPTGIVEEVTTRRKGHGGGGGGGKKRAQKGAAGARRENAIDRGQTGKTENGRGGPTLEVDPLYEGLVAFVFKVRRSVGGGAVYDCSDPGGCSGKWKARPLKK